MQTNCSETCLDIYEIKKNTCVCAESTFKARWDKWWVASGTWLPRSGCNISDELLLRADCLQWIISGKFVCLWYSSVLGNDKRQKVMSVDFWKRLQQAVYKNEYMVLPRRVFKISGVDVRSRSAIHVSIDSRHLRSQTSQHCKCLGTTLWLPCKVAWSMDMSLRQISRYWCDSRLAAILYCSSLPQCAKSMSPIQNSPMNGNDQSECERKTNMIMTSNVLSCFNIKMELRDNLISNKLHCNSITSTNEYACTIWRHVICSQSDAM